MTTLDQAAPNMVVSPEYAEYVRWLNEESALLDRHEYDDWLARLAPQVRYRMPARVDTSRRDQSGVSEHSFHMDEDHASLSIRIKRITSATNFAENPRTRTRRFVTNMMIDPGSTVDHITGSNYLLLLRSRGLGPDLELLSAERRDELVRGAAGLQLLRREVIVDQATLGVVHLATPL